MSTFHPFRLSLIPLITAAVLLAAALPAFGDDAIQPHPENPRYWRYKGEPVLLIGGSWQDNLFNHPTGLAEHLDLLASVGGNYVRNVMSHRNAGNVFAFARDADGRFDLDEWNEEYWQRFERFLELTHERDIIVQIEIWATWDHYEDHQSIGGWSHHPFNPANNSTYTAAESGLPTAVDYAPTGEPTDHAFFRTVPALENNERVLRYQRAFVDKLLSYSLQYPHVLYCMNNETGEHVAWGDYWANHVRQRADAAGVTVHVTDMRRSENIRGEDHAHIFDNPALYSFVDISQNNASSGRGQAHYDNILHVRGRTADPPRPINNNKNYGAVRHGEEESVARLVRIVFAGCASARFHRPHPLEDPADAEAATEWGLGLSPRAQAIIRSLRMVTDELNLLDAELRNDLLGDRADNEAYLLANVGRQYAAYFPEGGSVTIDLSAAVGDLRVRWMNLDEHAWSDQGVLSAAASVRLSAPGEGHWAAVITR
ncbi:MAG: hypothetical protein WD049_03175 [Candidatus Paceibacterota bacterium]